MDGFRLLFACQMATYYFWRLAPTFGLPLQLLDSLFGNMSTVTVENGCGSM